ncbi:MAG: 3'-5' exonuclease [Polyangiaceae bacterium]
MNYPVKATPSLRPRRCGPTFTAIDFETANTYRNSACAVGIVRVEQGRVVRRAHHLIRPPFRLFTFTYVHGIDWATVRSSPTFAGVWPLIARFFEGVDFVAAHNASFDESVLRAAARQYGVALPHLPFKCTLRLARDTWGFKPATLRHVADFLGIALHHHDAGSDAEACARIVLAAAA